MEDPPVDEPTVDDPSLDPSLPETRRGAKPRWRKGVTIAVAVPAFLLGATLAAHRPLLGMIVRHRAAGLGFDLDWDELDAGLGAVRLGHARVSLSGVRGVKVTAGSVRLARRGISFDEVSADDVAVTLEGAAGDRVLEVASWSGDHGDAFHLRGSASNLRLSWRARADAPAWLTMTGGTFTADKGSARFVAASTNAFGVPMGAVSATFAVENAGLVIEAGKRQGGEAPVVAILKTSARPPTLAITLRPVELSALGTALGVALPARGAIASGKADLTLGKAPAGTASLEVDGWVPQHPRAFDGVLAGKKTTLRTRLRASEDRATIKLDDVQVRAGKIELNGSGSLAEEGSHAVLRLDLTGPIPCADLARTVASQELGGILGGLAGDLAGSAVSGSAVVKLQVEADTRDLGAAKVTPKVGAGCRVQLPGL